MEDDIEKQFAEGVELRDAGDLVKAVNIFLDILQKYPEDSKTSGIYAVLAGIYFDLKDYSKSLEYFSKASQLRPQSELSSLGVYLSHAKLKNYGFAISELKRYLDQYPAKLYEDTLKELLNDLDSGYALEFKDVILDLANKNNVPIPKRFFYNG
jgi:tetratricopeptide (TPR) repeat protein